MGFFESVRLKRAKRDGLLCFPPSGVGIRERLERNLHNVVTIQEKMSELMKIFIFFNCMLNSVVEL